MLFRHRVLARDVLEESALIYALGNKEGGGVPQALDPAHAPSTATLRRARRQRTALQVDGHAVGGESSETGGMFFNETPDNSLIAMLSSHSPGIVGASVRLLC